MAKLILLVQPSSATAERVFSVLQNAFTNQQQSSPEDYISLSVVLHYNQLGEFFQRCVVDCDINIEDSFKSIQIFRIWEYNNREK